MAASYGDKTEEDAGFGRAGTRLEADLSLSGPVVGAATRALGMLGLQYVLGMAENLIGLPSETSGATNTASVALLVAHILVAIGLVITAARIAWLSRRADPGLRRLAVIALVVVVATFIAGGLTVGAESTSAAWSFVMAVGFLAAAGLYVGIVVQGRSSLRPG